MEFVAGFVGYSQDPATLSLRPKIGWGVVESGEWRDTPLTGRVARLLEDMQGDA